MTRKRRLVHEVETHLAIGIAPYWEGGLDLEGEMDGEEDGTPRRSRRGVFVRWCVCVCVCVCVRGRERESVCVLYLCILHEKVARPHNVSVAHARSLGFVSRDLGGRFWFRPCHCDAVTYISPN